MKRQRPIRITVFGSCVSRDLLEYCNPQDIEIQRYIARQSLISAYSPRPDVKIPLDKLASSFQRRMVEADIAGSLSSALVSASEDTDLILWDLTDERLGVLLEPSGAAFTRSHELIATGAEDVIADATKYVPFGTTGHYSLWTASLRKFREDVERLNLTSRVRLVAAPWALKTLDGAKVAASQNSSPREVNRIFKRYYRAVSRTTGISLVRPTRRPRASTEHRWGLAPFHYTDAVYLDLAAKIGLPLN